MKERAGVTLTTLAVIIVVMTILAGVATYTGIETINLMKRTQFNSELKIIHTRVDEIAEAKLSEEELSAYGQDLASQSSEIRAKAQMALAGASQEGFRYFTKNDLEKIGASGIDREVIINFTTREVVDLNGVKADGSYIYRMENWNKVEYQNPNTSAPEFSVSKKVYGITAQIQVSNILYKGNVAKGTIYYGEVENGEVKSWKTGSDTITIEKTATYRIKVEDAAGNSSSQDVEIVLTNKPKLAEGMVPVVYDETLGKWKVVEENSGEWYDYASDKKQWANAMTQDGLAIASDGTIESFGSMWVWIPRYMYQIPAENYHTSNAGVINIKFLKGTTNIATDNSNVTISNASGGDNWNVHPAFCDGTSNGFANGEWREELTGMWVAKFEAGYASGNNNAPVVASSVNYTQTTCWARAVETGTTDGSLPARNWLDGVYAVDNGDGTYSWKNGTPTAIKYPTFQPLTYSMNYIKHEDAFNVARAMTEEGNIYGFNSSNTDTHLMKDSEWGMVAYLSQSQYGLNGTNICINNVSLNSGGSSMTKEEGNAYASVYAVTGCTTATADAEEQIVTDFNTIKNITGNNPSTDGVYVWNQLQGQTASSTGNMYGIYDLSGGQWERTASYVGNGRNKDSFIWNGNSYIKNEYLMQYAHDTEKDNVEIGSDASGESTKINAASTANYALEANQRIYGNAIHETSTAGTDASSWYNDYSYFPGLHSPFLLRGASLWNGSDTGLFCFNRTNGLSGCSNGFRPVVVV